MRSGATVMLLALLACTSGTTMTSPSPSVARPSVSLQEREVLRIVAPDDRRYERLRPVCTAVEGCSHIEIDPTQRIVAQDHEGHRFELGPAIITGADVATATAIVRGRTHL